MSANPRCVTTSPGVYVSWGEPGCAFFLRCGLVLDVVPGSALEGAIGPANLSGVIPADRRGDGTCLSRAAQAN